MSPVKALLVKSISPDLDGVELVEVADPVRSPGALLVKVRAAALNYPDLLLTQGLYQLKPALPFVLGMELAGEVIECDAGSSFRPGDRVAVTTRLGAFAELATCREIDATLIPPAVCDVLAAAFGVAYLTAYVSLVRMGELKPGDWTLVHGASGGVGLAAVVLAKALGAKVIATSRSATKRKIIADICGPAAVLDSGNFRNEVVSLTGGGAQLIVDPVGGEVFAESTRCIAFGGRLLVVGFTGGIANLRTNLALNGGYSVVGVRAGEYGRRFPERGRANHDAIWSMAADGLLRPHVHAIYRLGEWRSAFEAMKAGAHIGKLVLVAD